MSSQRGTVIVALDVSTMDDALALVGLLGDRASFYKVGVELYTSAGPAVVERLIGLGKRVFLDLKLHDIPATVAGAVRVASSMGVDFLTVHATGGPTMLEAARAAASGPMRLLGVTVLTSMTPDEVSTIWGREIRSVRDEVGRLARLALDAGAHGVVASALEASWLRAQVGDSALIVTPGIRPRGADHDDQSRVATPAEAVQAGADYLVVGRAVTRAPDPAAALAEVLEDVRRAHE
jgi:orotidine-5'-phosphate decarboxylase